MTSDTRIAVAQEFFQRTFRGDVASALEFLDEKVSYHVPGTHELAGHFEGPEAVAQHLGKLVQLTHQRINVLQWEDWMAGVNHVAALTHMSVQLQGALHSFRAVYVIQVADDAKIRQIEVFFADQTAAERFFSVAAD